MIVFLDNGFDRDQILKELLQEQAKQPKCGYFQLRLYSKKHKIDYLRLYLNYITEEEIKEDLLNHYTELKLLKVI